MLFGSASRGLGWRRRILRLITNHIRNTPQYAANLVGRQMRKLSVANQIKVYVAASHGLAAAGGAGIYSIANQRERHAAIDRQIEEINHELEATNNALAADHWIRQDQVRKRRIIDRSENPYRNVGNYVPEPRTFYRKLPKPREIIVDSDGAYFNTFVHPAVALRRAHEHRQAQRSAATMPDKGAIDTHGDGADMADEPFNRDAENRGQQLSTAAALWNRAPRIYDDAIVVRMPVWASGVKAFSSFDANPQGAFGPLRLNDIYLPITGLATTRPHGYSFYSSLYSYYQVLETRVNVKYWISPVMNSTVNSTDGTAANTQLFNTSNYTPDACLRIGYMASSVTRNAPGSTRTWEEVATNNGADKTVIFGNINRLYYQSAQGPQQGGDSYTWVPATFDDLEIDITRNPMTAVGSSPNWLNYYDQLYSYDQATYISNSVINYTVRMEFLVHFKKINQTKYYTND